MLVWIVDYQSHTVWYFYLWIIFSKNPFNDSLTWNGETSTPASAPGRPGIGLYNLGCLPGTLEQEHSCPVWFDRSYIVLSGQWQECKLHVSESDKWFGNDHFKLEKPHGVALSLWKRTHLMERLTFTAGKTGYYKIPSWNTNWNLIFHCSTWWKKQNKTFNGLQKNLISPEPFEDNKYFYCLSVWSLFLSDGAFLLRRCKIKAMLVIT